MKFNLIIVVCFLAVPLFAASKKKSPKAPTKKVSAESTRKVTNDEDAAAPEAEAPAVAPAPTAPTAPTASSPTSTGNGESYLTLHPPRSNPKNWFLRITAAGGYSVVGSNDTRETDARTATGYNRNIFGDLSVAGQWGRSIGAEVEGYLGAGSSRSSASVDKVTGLLTTRARSLSQLGVMADAQVRIPVSQFRRDWGFHLGVGYGLATVKEVAPPSLASTIDSQNNAVSGLYATLGVEVRVIPEISAGVDYATSLLTSATRTTTSSGTDTKTNFDSGRFDRLRVNVAYLINADYRIGLMYTRRLVSGTNPDKTVDSEVANQVLATMQIIL